MSGAQGQSTLGGWSFHMRVTRQSPGIDLMAQSHSYPLRKSRIIQNLCAIELNFTFLVVFPLKVHLKARQLDLWIFSVGEPVDFKPARKTFTSSRRRFTHVAFPVPLSVQILLPVFFLMCGFFSGYIPVSALSAVIPFRCPRTVHRTRLISRT